MTINMYDSRSMIAAIERITVPGSFLKTKFFPTETTHTTRTIDVDVYKGGFELAPYVSPVKEGRVIAKEGFSTRTVKLPYVKFKYDITAVEAAKRMAGESIYSSVTPQDRARTIMARELARGIRSVDRLVEFQISQALTTGKVIAAGTDDNAVDWTVEINFQRNVAHTVALAGANTWTDNAVDPMANLQTWRRLGTANGMMNMTEVILGSEALTAFLNNAVLQKRWSVNSANWFKTTNMDMSGFDQASGVTSLGSIDGFNFWTYDQTYKHPTTGTLTPMIPTKGVVMAAVGSRNAVHYGAIQDFSFAGGLAETKVFPKSWLDEDPSVQWLLLQSSPLACLHEPDTTLFATVKA